MEVEFPGLRAGGDFHALEAPFADGQLRPGSAVWEDRRQAMPGAQQGQGPAVGAPAVRDHLGWIIQESGPSDARHAVLMLPRGLLPGAFFADVIPELQRRGEALRFVATTLPGHAGTPPAR